ncbi:complement component C8 gamma chain isoform X1 [Strix aluco]|uniref:complement component C8 gamma chain isoform X1 n=1 Tax=Strix aluco TaxID=111821 RepID=UPI003DA5734D
MVALGTLLLLGLLLSAPPGLGQGPERRRRRPPPPQSPLEKVAAQAELSLPQLAGRWFLVGMASRCGYLAEHSHRLEATAVTVTVLDGQSLAISTFRKLISPGRRQSPKKTGPVCAVASRAVAMAARWTWWWVRRTTAATPSSITRRDAASLSSSMGFVTPRTSFTSSTLTGRWYSIGLASNSNWFKEKKHLMKMCTTVISVTADGNLEVTSTYPKGDQCEKRNSLYTKTEQPGRFSYTSPRWGSKHDIRVVETNYDEYALVATQISKSTGSSTMVLLYSRTKELSPERLERFTQFSREQGLMDEEILILPQTDKCMADAA